MGIGAWGKNLQLPYANKARLDCPEKIHEFLHKIHNNQFSKKLGYQVVKDFMHFVPLIVSVSEFNQCKVLPRYKAALRSLLEAGSKHPQKM